VIELLAADYPLAFPPAAGPPKLAAPCLPIEDADGPPKEGAALARELLLAWLPMARPVADPDGPPKLGYAYAP